MAKFDSYVHDGKIQMIHKMLTSAEVGPLWQKFVSLGQPAPEAHPNHFKARAKAYDEYAIARDLYLGLPPVKANGIPRENSKSK